MSPSVWTAQILRAYVLVCHLKLDYPVRVSLKDNLWEFLQALWSFSHLDFLQLYTSCSPCIDHLNVEYHSSVSVVNVLF